MAHQTIAAAGNTEVSAYLTLIKLGFAVDRNYQDDEKIWTAENETIRLVAYGPLELLGLCLLSRERGQHWQASDHDIDEFLKRFASAAGSA